MQINYLYIICCILILGIFITCGDDNRSKAVVYENGVSLSLVSSTHELKGKEIELNTGYVKDINFFNEKLILLQYSGKNLITTFSTTDGSIHEFGHIGEGPGNIATPEFVKMVQIFEKTETILFYDYLSKSLYKLNLIEDLFQKIYNDNLNDAAIQSINIFGDSTIVIVGSSQSPLIFKNIKGNLINLITLINPLSRPLQIEEVQQLIPKDFGINSEHNLGFSWNIVKNCIDVYSNDGFLIKSYCYGENLNITNKINRNYAYYYNVKSCEDYLYGLYGGFESNDQFLNTMFKYLKSEIHIFNFKDNSFKRYRLDRLVNTCVIDFKNNAIYCIQPRGDENKPLIKYEMEN